MHTNMQIKGPYHKEMQNSVEETQKDHQDMQNNMVDEWSNDMFMPRGQLSYCARLSAKR